MKEIWKDIEGYKGLYQVSSLGRIKSLEKFNRTNCYNKLIGYKRKEKILKPFKNRGNYLAVDLANDTTIKRFSVHRLVAEAFIPNPSNCPCVNHKDENPSNNKADNLEWCSQQYNLTYGTRLEKVRKKLAYIVVCIENNNEYLGLSEASRETGINRDSIWRCCKKKQLTAGGYHWKYK